MAPVRIMMVLDTMDYGGTETHVISAAQSFERIGAEVVIAAGGGKLQDLFSRKFPVYSLNWPAPQTEEYGRTIEKLAALMKRENISIVHIHQTPSGLIAALAAERLRIPVVFTVHGTYYPQGELISVMEHSSAVISVSKPVEIHIRRFGRESHLIPNGVDLDTFSPSIDSSPHPLRQQFGIPEHAPVVVYASRLTWGKATVCSHLLAAAKHLRLSSFRNLEVVVVGDGFQAGDLRNLAARINTEIGKTFIHMAGNQTRMADYYRMSDCVVGTGRVALEAMACGKPVLAVGNAGYFGWVAPDYHDAAWEMYFGDHGSVRGVNRLILMESLFKGLSNRDGLNYHGSKNREWVEQFFNAEVMAQKMMEVYKGLLSE
ncbi:glycosyltransferase [Paenibacillus pinistramenti]|uniref:glycosyltransferase n=1 Tax=Paenibacillus pinistramenti TaxID=1768003 RepID=UPI0011099A50|nr:glycosyltransferase [Paenibacillus pinistramenti]